MFRVEGTLVHSHKLVLCTRCEVMSAMLTGGFAESQRNEVNKYFDGYHDQLDNIQLNDRKILKTQIILIQCHTKI